MTPLALSSPVREIALHADSRPGYENQTHYLRVYPVYIAALRRMLGDDPAQARHIISEPGLGYQLIK